MPKNFRHVRKTSVVRKPNGERLKLGGYRPDQRHQGDKRYKTNLNLQDLPPKVDLRPYMTRVENQGASNSCTANAMAGAYEYLANRLTGQAGDVSRLFIYYNARELDGASDQDEGTYLRSCVTVLRKYGTCSEATWPFELERILELPYDEAYEEAENFLIEDAYRLKVDLDEMRSCLAEGYPFAFGLELFGSFQKAGSKGFVPMPDPEQEQHDGGHAMLCVGYSDPDTVFIVRNSWGEDWGDRGYCYIPYAYMTNREWNGDLWTIRCVRDHIDLSQGIQGGFTSLFSPELAAIVATFQNASTADVAVDFQDEYEVTYEEQCIYIDGEGYIAIDELEDWESLYYQDYEQDEELEDSDIEMEADEDEYFDESEDEDAALEDNYAEADFVDADYEQEYGEDNVEGEDLEVEDEEDYSEDEEEDLEEDEEDYSEDEEEDYSEDEEEDYSEDEEENLEEEDEEAYSDESVEEDDSEDEAYLEENEDEYSDN